MVSSSELHQDSNVLRAQSRHTLKNFLKFISVLKTAIQYKLAQRYKLGEGTVSTNFMQSSGREPPPTGRCIRTEGKGKIFTYLYFVSIKSLAKLY